MRTRHPGLDLVVVWNAFSMMIATYADPSQTDSAKIPIKPGYSPPKFPARPGRYSKQLPSLEPPMSLARNGCSRVSLSVYKN
jgi:hypothetical protein